MAIASPDCPVVTDRIKDRSGRGKPCFAWSEPRRRFPVTAPLYAVRFPVGELFGSRLLHGVGEGTAVDSPQHGGGLFHVDMPIPGQLAVGSEGAVAAYLANLVADCDSQVVGGQGRYPAYRTRVVVWADGMAVAGGVPCSVSRQGTGSPFIGKEGLPIFVL